MLTAAFGLVVVGARIGHDTVQLAARPLREVGRLPVVGRHVRAGAEQLTRTGEQGIGDIRRQLETVAERALAAPELRELALAALDRIDVDLAVDAILRDPRCEQAIDRVMESRLLDEVTERLLESPQLQRVVEHVAGLPEVRTAVTQQTETLAGEIVVGVRERSERADASVERRIRGWLHRPRPSTS